MKPLKLGAPWEEVRENLKENDYRLTDEDLDYEAGKEHELITRLMKKMGRTAEEIIAYIESVSHNKGKAL